MKTDSIILVGDCRSRLTELADGSVHCIVTSPPYFRLRDYRTASQIGLEKSLDEYIAGLAGVFRECRRILRDDGTFWLNIGDKYLPKQRRLMVPHRLAIALVEDGWLLQDEVIWSKPATIPQAVNNRCTQSHEIVFMLAKRARGYFTDPIERREPAATNWTERGGSLLNDTGWSRGAGTNAHDRANTPRSPATRNRRSVWTIATEPSPEHHFAMMPTRLADLCLRMGAPTGGVCSSCGAPRIRKTTSKTVERDRPNRFTKRTGDRWQGRACRNDISGSEVTDHGFVDGCECGATTSPGRVLDPFSGAATTLIAAARLGLSGIGIEANPQYAEMGRVRFNKLAASLFASPARLVMEGDGDELRRVS